MRQVSPSGDARPALRLLGATELTADGEAIPLPRTLERALLVRLALARGAGVADDLLARDLWHPEVADPAGRVRVLAHRLRRTLGNQADLLRRTPAGYALDAVPADLVAVDDELGRLQRARQVGDVRAAQSALVDALSKWRGPALADLRAIPFGEREGTRLDSLRVELLTDRLAGDLAQGAGVSSELDHLVAGHPANERLVGLSALAHYQAGRQAEALARIARLRTALAGELGVDLSPDLAALELKILRQDPSLAPPATRSETPRPGWPASRTTFVGRDRERATILAKLAAPALVTVTGAPGMGKTRLAREVAAAARATHRSVVWLDLAPLVPADALGPHLATAIGTQPGRDGLNAGSLEKLAGALLVIDNAEHLVDQVADLVSSLRRTTVGPAILITSQRPLRVLGENVSPLGPLDRDAAIALFCSRSGEPADDQVDAICAGVDGLPLAIELAAGLTRTLTVPQIADRIGNRLHLLVGGNQDDGARHNSLRGAVSWSYSLLEPPAQQLLRVLAAFTGGCTLEAAESLAGEGLDPADVAANLSDLLERCLVTMDSETDPRRFGLLDTVRDFALEQLRGADEEVAVRRRHANWCAGLIAAAKRTGVQQIDRLRELDAERGNLRAAFEWSLGEQGEVATVKAIGGPIGWCGWGRRQADQDPDWLRRSLEAAGPAPTAERAAILRAANIVIRNSGGDLSDALAAAEEALSIFTALEDEAGCTSTLLGLCITSITLRNYEAALRYGRECRQRAEAADEDQMPGGQQLICFSTNAVGMALRCLGRTAEAELKFLESQRLRLLLEEPADLAGTLGSLAMVARQQGETDRSRELCLEALRLSREHEQTAQVLGALEGLAALELICGRPTEALRLLIATEQRRIGDGIPLLIPDEIDERDQTYAAARSCLGVGAEEIAASAVDLPVEALADELLRRQPATAGARAKSG
jgi:predicted ATPase/DNA-binding SARP family transcriptional activator